MSDPIELEQEVINDLSTKLSKTLEEIEQWEAIPDSEAEWQAAIKKAERIRNLQSVIEKEFERIQNTPKDMNDAIRMMIQKRISS